MKPNPQLCCGTCNVSQQFLQCNEAVVASVMKQHLSPSQSLSCLLALPLGLNWIATPGAGPEAGVHTTNPSAQARRMSVLIACDVGMQLQGACINVTHYWATNAVELHLAGHPNSNLVAVHAFSAHPTVSVTVALYAPWACGLCRPSVQLSLLPRTCHHCCAQVQHTTRRCMSLLHSTTPQLLSTGILGHTSATASIELYNNCRACKYYTIHQCLSF